MRTFKLEDGPAFDPAKAAAAELLRADRASVRVIRLGVGQSLPAHSHGESDLVLYVAEGTVVLGDEVVAGAGTIAHLLGSEVLRARCEGDVGATLLAFLAPPFPP